MVLKASNGDDAIWNYMGLESQQLKMSNNIKSLFKISATEWFSLHPSGFCIKYCTSTKMNEAQYVPKCIVDLKIKTVQGSAKKMTRCVGL